MRSWSPLLTLSLTTLLAACSGGTIESAGPNPPGVEAVPASADAIGTERGGAAREVSDITWTRFGAPETLTSSVKVRDFLDDPSPYVGKEVLLEGTVVDVCQKAGCWMVLTDGGRQIRVTMKDQAFSVAKDGAGAWARVQGTVSEVAPDPEATAHFEGESARPDLLPEKQGQRFQVEATGVALQDRVKS